MSYFEKNSSKIAQKGLQSTANEYAEERRIWNTSLLFDLNYIFINGSLAFSPG